MTLRDRMNELMVPITLLMLLGVRYFTSSSSGEYSFRSCCGCCSSPSSVLTSCGRCMAGGGDASVVPPSIFGVNHGVLLSMVVVVVRIRETNAFSNSRGSFCSCEQGVFCIRTQTLFLFFPLSLVFFSSFHLSDYRCLSLLLLSILFFFCVLLFSGEFVKKK